MDQNETEIYRPLESHRFRLNEHSKKILNGLRNELQEIQSVHPEVIGATVYGSQVKGIARGSEDPLGQSDIDCYIFVDGESIGIQDNGDEGTYPKEGDESWDRVNDSLGSEIRGRVERRFGLFDSTSKDMRVRILTKARVDNDIDRALAHEQAIIDADANNTARPRLSETRPHDLDKLFHLQLGHGLDAHRKYILERLKRSGAAGEAVWKDCASSIDLMESGKLPKEVGIQRGMNNLYPRDIEGALRMYHLTDVDPRYAIQ